MHLIKHQIALTLCQDKWILLHRQIARDQSNIWQANIFYDDLPKCDSRLNDLVSDGIFRLTVPKELKLFFSTLQNKQFTGEKIQFAFAFMSPHWIANQIQVPADFPVQCIPSHIENIIKENAPSKNEYEIQYILKAPSKPYQAEGEKGADQIHIYFTAILKNKIDQLNNWLNQMGWSWSVIDIDFYCLRRVLEFIFTNENYQSGKKCLLFYKLSNSFMVFLWGNQTLLFYDAKLLVQVDIMDAIQFYFSILLSEIKNQQCLILGFNASKSFLKLCDENHISFVCADKFLGFDSDYLIPMGLFFRSWN